MEEKHESVYVYFKDVFISQVDKSLLVLKPGYTMSGKTWRGSPVGSRPSLLELNHSAQSTHLQFITLHRHNFLTNHAIKKRKKKIYIFIYKGESTHIKSYKEYEYDQKISK